MTSYDERPERETSWATIFDPATWVEKRTPQAMLRELPIDDVSGCELIEEGFV